MTAFTCPGLGDSVIIRLRENEGFYRGRVVKASTKTVTVEIPPSVLQRSAGSRQMIFDRGTGREWGSGRSFKAHQLAPDLGTGEVWICEWKSKNAEKLFRIRIRKQLNAMQTAMDYTPSDWARAEELARGLTEMLAAWQRRGADCAEDNAGTQGAGKETPADGRQNQSQSSERTGAADA